MSLLNSKHLHNDMDESHPFFEVYESSDTYKGPGVALLRENSLIGEKSHKSIQNFKNHFKNIQIFDFGILEAKDTMFIINSIETYNKVGIIPVFIGIDLELAGQIAAKINSDIYQIGNVITNLTNSASFIKSSFIGYQRHLCTLDDIHEIESNSYNSLSLGKLRSFPQLLEPTLRDAGLIHIDLNVVRASDVPNTQNALPTGLNAEELCQLLKYAGNGDQLKALFINAKLKNEQYCDEESMLVAEAIWYFMEGVNMNIKDHPSVNKNYAEFIIQSNSIDEELTFIKNNHSSKWWVRTEDIHLGVRYIACSYEEYQASIGEEIPDRIVKFVNSKR